MKEDKLGLVHIYTGKGKGKTTAALGLALRAIGRGLSVYVAAFLKPRSSGEVKAAARLRPLLIFEPYPDDNKDSEKVKKDEIKKNEGKDIFSGWLCKGDLTEEDRRKAVRHLEKAKTAMLSGKYRVVVLDEVIVANQLGLLSLEQIEQFIQVKPAQVELVLTGRGASAELIALADVVTEMKEIRHPFQRGIAARKGIDF